LPGLSIVRETTLLENPRYRDLGLLAYMVERERIRLLHAAGEPRPWTTDPILHEFRFTNIDREHDKTTVWIREHWREPYANDEYLWFGLAVARLTNHIETMEDLGYPVPWDPEHWTAVLNAREARGQTIWSPAYQIGTGGRKAPEGKIAYQRDEIFTPIWNRRERITAALRGASLAEAFTVFARLPGHGGTGFQSAQVVADLKHTRILRQARDWWRWAHSGPGSGPGLNLVLRRPAKAAWIERDWHRELLALIRRLDPELEAAGLPALCAQNWQHNLCEIHKFWGIQSGEVRPKRRYQPSGQGSLF
jgi:hypothetical protein